MAKFKVTDHALNGVGESDVFEAAGYSIKDGWVHMTDGVKHSIASVRESDVKRIDKTN